MKPTNRCLLFSFNRQVVHISRLPSRVETKKSSKETMDEVTSTRSPLAPRRRVNTRIESLYLDAKYRNSRLDLAQRAAERANQSECTFAPVITTKGESIVRDDPFNALYVDAHRRRNKIYAMSGARLKEAENKGSPTITTRGRKAWGKLRGGWNTRPAKYASAGAGDGAVAAAAAAAGGATPGVAMIGGRSSIATPATGAGARMVATAATPEVAMSGGGSGGESGDDGSAIATVATGASKVPLGVLFLVLYRIRYVS